MFAPTLSDQTGVKQCSVVFAGLLTRYALTLFPRPFNPHGTESLQSKFEHESAEEVNVDICIRRFIQMLITKTRKHWVHQTRDVRSFISELKTDPGKVLQITIVRV